MATLDKKFFEGGDSVSEPDVKKCELQGSRDVTDVLANFGWNGGACCGIVLQWSPNNERVVNSNFVTAGAEDKEFKIEASKLWQDADMSVSLVVRLPCLDSFKFTDGGLTSDLLPDTDVIHFFNSIGENGRVTPILAANLTGWGIGRFVIRLVCHVSESSEAGDIVRIKYNVMIMPVGRPELEQLTTQHNSPSWPGLKLGEGEMPLLPKPTTAWQCPVLPLLKTGMPLSLKPSIPSSSRLRETRQQCRRNGRKSNRREASSRLRRLR